MFQSANEATFLVDLFQILYFDGLFMGHAPRLDEKRILPFCDFGKTLSLENLNSIVKSSRAPAMFTSPARAPVGWSALNQGYAHSKYRNQQTQRAPGCPRPSPQARTRFRPPAAAADERAPEKAQFDSPSVPTVRRPPPPPGTTEVVIRYAYPGVRFSQAKVAMARVAMAGEGSVGSEGSEEGIECSSILSITGADVARTIEHDGVDLKRWRLRVALDHVGSSSGIARAMECENAESSLSNDSTVETHSKNESHSSFRSRQKRSVLQSHVGWSLLRDDDIIDFHENSVGLLVQLEDGLLFSSVDGDWDVRDGKNKKKGGGGRRGVKARAKREKSEDAEEEGSTSDESLSNDSSTPSTSTPAHRASSYWQLANDTSKKSGNNPYAGASSTGTSIWPSDPDSTNAGYFGIGIVKPKHEANVGTLWRSAWQLGSSFIFTVGARFKYQASDTTQAHKQIPHFKHERWESFAESSPHGAVWVAIEMGSGSVPLQEFVHPPRAVYILGSEDNGLNRPIVEACQCHVSLPKWVGRSSSYNVAMAGTVVMYDRMVKRLREGALKIGDDC